MLCKTDGPKISLYFDDKFDDEISESLSASVYIPSLAMCQAMKELDAFDDYHKDTMYFYTTRQKL